MLCFDASRSFLFLIRDLYYFGDFSHRKHSQSDAGMNLAFFKFEGIIGWMIFIANTLLEQKCFQRYWIRVQVFCCLFFVRIYILRSMFGWLCRATCCSVVSTSMLGVSHAVQNEKKPWKFTHSDRWGIGARSTGGGVEDSIQHLYV